MSDTPKLMVQTGDGTSDWPTRSADDRDRDLVVAWLREQGAGEEVVFEADGELCAWDDDGDWVYLADGRYLVIPIEQFESDK